MSELTAKEINQLFKDVFLSPKGHLVLDRLKLFCNASVNQDLADESVNKTYYNLGRYSVYREIIRKIEAQNNQVVNDCVIETKNETGE